MLHDYVTVHKIHVSLGAVYGTTYVLHGGKHEPLFEENPDIPLYIVNSLIYRFIDRSTTIGTVLVVVHVNH
jgi:hypothetical protein